MQQGHRLELYLVPFLNYATYADSSARDYMLQRQGLDSSNIMNIRTDYSFTIQNAASYATLPMVEESTNPPADGDGKTSNDGAGKVEEAKPQPLPQPANPQPEKTSTTTHPATTVRSATSTAQRTPNTGDSSPSLVLSVMGMVIAALFAAGLGLMRDNRY